MPRKPPGTVRAGLRTRWSTSSSTFAKTPKFVQSAAAARLGVGHAGSALQRYQEFLQRPGRWLYPSPDCPCCDPIDARDELELALRALPPNRGRPLRELVARLDDEFRRRTFPDPHAEPGPWWHRRLRER